MPANRKPRRAQPRPKTAPAPFERGLALHRAMRLHPNPADRAVTEGQALLDGGHAEDAAVLLTAACQRHPGDVRILALNGRALLALGRTGPAIGALFMAAELRPDDPAIQSALGSALLDHGDPAQAMVHCLNAFRLAPDPAHATTLSCVLIALGHYAEALALADHALDQRRGSFEALVNRALALEGLGRFEDAVHAGQHAVGRHNLAVTLLSLGRLTPETWDLYEWRLLLKGKPAWLEAVTRWEGEDIAGRTILLHAEQGLGDTLQFVRYAPLVAARAGRVILAVQPALARLLRTVPGVDHVVAVGGVLPPFDVVCPLLSLPRLLGTTLDSIPPALPYADEYAPWDDAAGPALRVGLVWSGSKTFADDRQRSLPPAALMGLAGLPGVQFYSLQRHEAGGTAPPPELGVIDLMDGVQDFADTAARVAGLDLVIAVDTAVAHLAATIGKPVWLLSRFRGCWRWLLGRADSPWYPSLSIVRQDRPNDWGGVIAQVRQDLAALALQPIARPAAMVSRPAATAPRSCKACGTPSPAMGSVDFNKNCEDRRRAALPLSGRAVTYHRCPACALLFTGDFDGWDREDFRREIYNEGYADVDPDFAGSRPAASAELIGTLFGPACRGVDVLDFGGGDGALAALLASRHGMEAEVYDPFNPACDVAPERQYSLVTCFEVLEHTPDPRATLREVAARVQEDGIVVFSTLLQPGDFAQRGLGWWDVAPRNGHVTIYSAQALRALWAELGFQLISQGDGLHIAYRTVPAFAQGLACFAV